VPHEAWSVGALKRSRFTSQTDLLRTTRGPEESTGWQS
jgi:hypothetical protein